MRCVGRRHRGWQVDLRLHRSGSIDCRCSRYSRRLYASSRRPGQLVECWVRRGRYGFWRRRILAQESAH
jgi:hypothetical protein